MSQNPSRQPDIRSAEIYEEYIVPCMLRPWVPGLLELALLRVGDRVLDVACGTGVVTRVAAREAGAAGRVTGLDVNAGMLAVARALPPPSGAAVDWVECDAADMDLPDGAFDVVLCQQGLQFFPDKPAALREMHRVMRPGGRLAVSVWKKANPYNTALREAIGKYISEGVAAKARAATCLGDPGTLCGLIADAGFREVKVRSQVMTVHLPEVKTFALRQLASMPIADTVEALDEETRASLAGDVAAAVGPYADGDGVTFPNEINLASARA